MFRTTVGKTVLNLTLATSVIYGGGVALSLKNDAFNELFTDNVPLAEDIVDYIQSFETTKKDYNIQNFKEKFGELEKTLNVPKSGLIAQKVENVKEEINKKISKDNAKASPVEVVKSKIQLKPIELKAKDANLQKVITEFNSLIAKINNDSLSKDDQFIKIVESIGDLDKNLASLQQKQNEQLTGQIQEAIAKKEKEVLSSFTDEFNNITKRIDQEHQAKLAEEITQKTKVISKHYENIVKTNQINATKQFTDLISDSIEKEREGKYSKFNELNTKLETLQKLVLTIDDHLNNSDLKLKLQLTLNKLKNKLNSNQIEDLNCEITELNKLAKESKNKVISSAIDSIDPKTIKAGLLTNSQINSRFQLLIPELRSAALLPPNAGLLGHLSSLVFSKFLLGKEGHVEGKDIESVIARVNNYLTSNQLDHAVEEISQLKGWNRKLADDWLIESRKRLEVEFLVDLIDLESRTLF